MIDRTENREYWLEIILAICLFFFVIAFQGQDSSFRQEANIDITDQISFVNQDAIQVEPILLPENIHLTISAVFFKLSLQTTRLHASLKDRTFHQRFKSEQTNFIQYKPAIIKVLQLICGNFPDRECY